MIQDSKIYVQDNMTIHNADCMEIMAGYDDNYFDLAVVDPPYGIGDKLASGGRGFNAKYRESTRWDVRPDSNYFRELERVSVNQIIWGGNYFSNYIDGSRCFIVWQKLHTQPLPTMADCEMALTSFDRNASIYASRNSDLKIHPTQKPIALYNWIYANYAEEGQKILDTHGGSFSNAIAAHYAKMHFVGCELDEDYYKAAIERIRKETRQQEFNF